MCIDLSATMGTPSPIVNAIREIRISNLILGMIDNAGERRRGDRYTCGEQEAHCIHDISPLPLSGRKPDTVSLK